MRWRWPLRMEVDAIIESLDHCYYSWHQLKTCGCVQEIYKSTYCAETEIIKEIPLESSPEHLHFLVSEGGSDREGRFYSVYRRREGRVFLREFMTAFCGFERRSLF